MEKKSTSKGLLIGLVVVAFIGAGYFVFQKSKTSNKQDSLKSVFDNIDVMSENTETPNTQPEEELALEEDYEDIVEAEDALASSGAAEIFQASSDVTYSGDVTAEYISDNSRQIVRLRLEKSYNAAREQIQVMRPYIELDKKKTFVGRWASPSTFDLIFTSILNPSDRMTIKLKKLPLKGGFYLNFGEGATATFVPPPFDLKFELGGFKKGYAELNAVSNYPIQLSTKASIYGVNRIQSDGKKVRLKDPRIIFPREDSKFQKKIVLQHRGIKGEAIELTLNGNVNVAQYKVPLKRNYEVKLRELGEISISSAEPVEGSEYFAIKFRCSYKSQGNRNRRRSRYYSTPCMVDREKAASYIRTNPAVKFSVVPMRNEFKIVGKFEARQTYDIKILEGLPAKHDGVLNKDADFVVQMPDYKKSFSFKGKARYMLREGKPTLSYEARNYEKVYFKIQKIHAQNIVFWLSGESESSNDRVGNQIKDFAIDIQSNKNEKFHGQLDLSDLVKQGDGVYQIEAMYEETYGTIDRATLVLTDIMMIAKQQAENLSVWTRSMETLKPKTGISIRVYSRSNKLLGQCETSGSDGSCTVKGVYGTDVEPKAVIAFEEGDLNYLNFGDVAINDEKLHRRSGGDYKPNKFGFDIYAYSSRGVYRPGEKVHLSAVVRDRKFNAVAGTAFKVLIKNPRSKTVYESVLKTDASGMMPLTYQTGAGFETGQYEWHIKSGKFTLQTYPFYVEEFVPERIGIKMSSAKKEYIGHSKVVFNVDAKYLFGPPVNNGDYEVACSLSPAYDTVPNNSEFHTGLSDESSKQRSFTLSAVQGKLDKNGLAQANCDFQSLKQDFPAPMNLTARTSVRESGSGRATVNSHTVLVSNTPQIVGVKAVASDRVVEVSGRVFDLNGKTVDKDTKLSVSMLRKHYNWVYGYDPSYGYSRWHSEYFYVPDGITEDIVAKNGQFQLKMKASYSWGRYLVRVEDKSTGYISEDTTYMGYYWYDVQDEGGEFATPAARAPDQIPLTTNKKKVDPGESVKVAGISPFAGKGMICTETDTVSKCQWIDVTKGQFEVEMKAPAVLPNFYVTALVFKNPKEGDNYIPARAWGGVSVGILPSNQKTTVAVTVPQKIRPNRSMTIGIEAKNLRGRNASATVAIIDEGILQLTKFQSPDPLKYFHRPRSLGVVSYETLGWSYVKRNSPGGGGPGAGGQEAAVMPVRLVAFWQDGIKLDKNGKAQISVDLPPFQGKLRTMVVVSGQEQYGSADAYTTVSDPVVIQPTLPRFLSFGDEFDITMMIANTTSKTQKTRVTANANVPIAIDKHTQNVTLAANESKVIRFPTKVTTFEGRVKFDFEARYGNDKSVDSFDLQIIPSTSRVTRIVDVAMGENIDLNQIIPDDLRSETVSVAVTSSPVLVGSVLPQIKRLVRYPYGCLEQTTSTTFPLLVMRDVIKGMDIKDLKDKPIDSMVYAGIHRVASMQSYDGGFAYWPGGGSSVQWGTAYATHMLLTAKKLGYKVSKSTLNDALDYLEKMMSSDYSYSRNKRAEPYMAYVLGMAKRHQLQYLRNVALTSKDTFQDLEQDFLLMGAMHLAGEQHLVDVFAKGKTLYKLTANRSGHQGDYYSDKRSRALRLAIAEELWPGDVKSQSLARKVVSDIKQRYWTTQETAWGLIGLVSRQNKLGWPDKSLEYTLNYAGKNISPSSESEYATHWNLPQNKKLGVLKLTMDKPVDNFATFVFNGYKKKYDTPRTGNVSVKRSYYDHKGNRLKIENVKQGQLVVVELAVTNTGSTIENAALVDRVPSGLEIENPRLGRGQQMDWIPSSGLLSQDWYMDIRDNAIRYFGKLRRNRGGSYYAYYLARAVTSGDFVSPSAKIEDMYDPEVVNFSKVDIVKVKAN